MYAIIATGGKQYKVAEGDIINVEKLAAEAGETVTFDSVLAVNDGAMKAGADVANASVSATVVKEGGELFLEYGDHHRVILTPERAAQLADYVGREVTFGIRPEDVFASEKYEAAHEHNTVEASVRVFEMLGAEVFLYLTVDGFDVTCREHPSTKAKPGDIMSISFDVNKIHVFDKETQMTITN